MSKVKTIESLSKEDLLKLKVLKEKEIDKWALYEIAQYCDGLVPDSYGSLEPRFTINHIISSREEAYKVMNDLASIFRGMIFYANGSIFAVQDKFKKAVYQFNNSNVADGNFTYSSSSVHPCVHAYGTLTSRRPSATFSTEMTDRR
jgi:predicted phage tail protein